MTRPEPASFLDWDFPRPRFHSFIQAPLPNCLDTPPILLTIEGQGTEGQDSVPLAPPEELANDNT